MRIDFSVLEARVLRPENHGLLRSIITLACGTYRRQEDDILPGLDLFCENLRGRDGYRQVVLLRDGVPMLCMVHYEDDGLVMASNPAFEQDLMEVMTDLRAVLMLGGIHPEKSSQNPVFSSRMIAAI